MAGHGHVQLDPNELRQLGPLGGKLRAIGSKLAIIGFVVMIALALIGDSLASQRVLYAYLANFVFFISIALGALMFVLVHTLCRTGTVTTYKRLAENIAGTLPYLAAFVVPILLAAGTMYHWAHPGGDPILEEKTPWLNMPFWVLRVVFYLVVFSAIAGHFINRSRKQDQSGDPQITRGLQAVAGPSIIAFAFLITGLSFDLIKSLDGHWFSTMFGVYYFSGAFMAFHCLLGLWTVRLGERGILNRSINREHYHDIGKMMFAFMVFWIYISFSQYMLIWYGNIPEETVWYVRRGGGLFDGQTSDFSMLLLILLLGHFVIPFFGMLSRTIKRKPARLAKWAVWRLVMHWLDMIWLIRPELRTVEDVTATAALNWVDFAALLAGLVAFGGVFIWALAKVCGDKPLLAERDPRLGEALAFENF